MTLNSRRRAPAVIAKPFGAYASPFRRWHAVRTRDKKADGTFVYAVRTTSVFCRPGCPARLARRDNVLFFDDAAAAESAGYRPCKRCRPTELSLREARAQVVTKACKIIETAESAPKLAELAEVVGLSRYHLLRVFKSVLGISPREYAASLKATQVRTALPKADNVTVAIYSAGYNSSSRFYDGANTILGMTPSDFRRGGKGVAMQYIVTKSTLGTVLIAGTDRGVSSIQFGERAALIRQLKAAFPAADIMAGNAQFKRWVKAVLGSISKPDTNAAIPLDVQGTAFQQRVWQALRDIPPGEVASYSQIATRIGKPSATRAVARACATNPVAVVVPCHRVVRSNGQLGGFRWGLDRKEKLLEREKRRTDVSRAAAPRNFKTTKF